MDRERYKHAVKASALERVCDMKSNDIFKLYGTGTGNKTGNETRINGF